MGNKNRLPSDFDLVTKKKADKRKWRWIVRVDKLRYYYSDGKPVITGFSPIPEFLRITTGSENQEFELIDALTTDRGNFGAPSETKLYKILKNEPDGLYRLTVFKQSVSSRVHGVDNYANWGWCLISKNRDKILWETRYFQNGPLFGWNLDKRDPLEDARRRHINEIPSGGIDYRW